MATFNENVKSEYHLTKLRELVHFEHKSLMEHNGMKLKYTRTYALVCIEGCLCKFYPSGVELSVYLATLADCACYTESNRREERVKRNYERCGSNRIVF
jgi:hypothetical protein